MIAVFTDLDGTLLDNKTYSFDKAKTSIELLKSKNVSLIVVTTKTADEIEDFKRQEIGEFFIVETGCEIIAPDECFKLGKGYRHAREVLIKIKEKFPVKGFGDMSEKEISEITGLSLENSKKAKKRKYTEPFIPLGEFDLQEAEQIAERYGYRIYRGGRFYHIVDKECDKGKAVKFLIDKLKRKYGSILTIGLGDSKVDEPFLKIMDIPVLIPKKIGIYEKLDVENVRLSPYPAPLGWDYSIKEILNELEAGSS
ncbi:HAD-IIB family hydrolase [Desulfurobacterium atlanticum]|nr:HAD-IIB family hydrolase [Desulfurobacterium atlanticum]